MPAHRAPSPTVAIRQWLSRTENNTATHESLEDTPAHNEGSHLRTDKTRPSARHSHMHTISSTGDTRHRQRRDEEPHSNAREKEAAAPSREVRGGHEVGLAERLGLHAPFRTFGDDDGTLDRPIDAPQRNAERRRTASTSSLLEPAVITVQPRRPPTPKQDVMGNEEKRKIDDMQGGSLDGSDDGSLTSGPSAKAAKTYKRRSRHKPREDKYDLKQGAKTRERNKFKKDDAAGKQKKRKRREKSGNTLMHEFAASNVAQDRLTIKPTASVGLFGKGRASSPVRRKGLPDLTFSEMTFHRSRRERPDANKQPALEQKKRQKKDRTADTEAEISRYFMSKVPRPGQDLVREEDDDPLSPHRTVRKHGHGFRRSSNSSLPPVELPDRPFLGFGSSGLSLTSPTKPAKSSLPRLATPHSSPKFPPSIGATSYITWSVTERSGSHARTPSVHSASQIMAIPPESTASRSHHQRQYSRTTKAHHLGTSYLPEKDTEAKNVPASDRGNKRPREPAGLSAIPQDECAKRNSLETQSQPGITTNISRSAAAHCLEPEAPGAETSKALAEPLCGHDRQRIGHMLPSIQESSTSTDLGKPSLSFDMALEDLLQTCHKGFESSRLPQLNASRQSGQIAPREPFNPIAKPTVSRRYSGAASERFDSPATNTMSTEHLPLPSKDRDSASDRGDKATAPRGNFYVPSPQSIDLPGPVQGSTKFRPLSRAYSTSRHSTTYVGTPTYPTQPSPSRTDSRSAWNAYQNLYETQLDRSPNDSYVDGGEEQFFRGYPDPPLQNTGFRSFLPGLFEPDGAEVRLDESHEQSIYDNAVSTAYEESGMSNNFEQPILVEDALTEHYELDDRLEKMWKNRSEEYPPDIDTMDPHLRGSQAYLAHPWSLATGVEPASIEYVASPIRSAEESYGINETIDQLLGGYIRTDGDAELHNSHLPISIAEDNLSDFWKPHRLY